MELAGATLWTQMAASAVVLGAYVSRHMVVRVLGCLGKGTVEVVCTLALTVGVLMLPRGSTVIVHLADGSVWEVRKAHKRRISGGRR